MSYSTITETLEKHGVQLDCFGDYIQAMEDIQINLGVIKSVLCNINYQESKLLEVQSKLKNAKYYIGKIKDLENLPEEKKETAFQTDMYLKISKKFIADMVEYIEQWKGLGQIALAFENRERRRKIRADRVAKHARRDERKRLLEERGE